MVFLMIKTLYCPEKRFPESISKHEKDPQYGCAGKDVSEESGQAAGPFDLATLQQMAIAGQLAAASLVWKAGMAEWAKAETMEELKGIFGQVPPAIPTE